jgi:Tfp pilus assembly protein PilX
MQHHARPWRHPLYDNERGAVLAMGLMLLTVLALFGMTGITITSTDVLISGNYKQMAQALHAAEAGTEEARARLRTTAPSPIADPAPTSTQWRAFIGSVAKAQARGYDTSNAAHSRYDSLQNALDYTVRLQHATNAAGTSVLYWGDDNSDGIPTRNTTTGVNIYTITGYVSAAATKAIEIEAVRVPPVSVPSALYVEASTSILGSSTNIIGTNGAGCTGPDVAGIATTLAEASSPITQSGHPDIEGDPPTVYSTPNLDIQTMLDTYKPLANFAYTVTSATQTGSDTPGPGDGWGIPTPGANQDDPTSCNVRNVVHYRTNGTYVRLSGG